MSNPRKALLSVLFLFLFHSLFAQKAEDICYNPNAVKDTTKKSIKSTAFAVLNGDSITIRYHSPGVRKRIIWGGLVPFDEVWVTGAHDATALEMPKPFVVDGKEIPAGKYALFTIPRESDWVVILNRNWRQHLASEYDEKEDIVRVVVKPRRIDHLERLQYFIETNGRSSGTLSVAWEKVRIDLPFKMR
jgi:hypothetical protein